MKIGIGLSLEPDPFRAGVDAVRQAKKAVPRPSLAIVFGSIHYDQKKVHEGICSELDARVLMGGSSYAEITNAGVTKKSVAALLLDLDEVRPKFASADVTDDPARTGRVLTRGLCGRRRGDLPLALLFSSIATGYDNETLRALNHCLDDVPVVGGMCCGDYDLSLEDPRSWINWQYIGPKLTNKAARLALLEFSKKRHRLGFGFEHGWQAVAPPVTVTKANGGDVYEVDGIPVIDYYRQFLGHEPSRGFFAREIQRYGFSLLLDGARQGRTMLKLPVATDFKKGCISYFPAEDLQGRRVQLILASRKGLVEGAERSAKRCLEALGGRKPSLVFVVSCCTRNAILHSKMDSEVDAIRKVLGREVPIFGFYSAGEIMPFLSRYEQIVDSSLPFAGSFYHTTTLGVFALAGPKLESVAIPPRKAPEHDPARLAELLAKSEETLDKSERFLANLSRKSYLDGEALKKQTEVIHRYTPHDVYARIGANTAKGIYELSDAEFKGTFMFMDVKGFTSYTELHGSKQVVRALNEIFEPATRIVYESGGDVDKFIGDCIFAAFKKPADAVAAASRILKLLAVLRKRGSPFTVRIGINSGRAVRANVGSRDRREYTYIGDAVNLAQRLESNCAPGRMLLERGVYVKAGAELKSAERRTITVKGRQRPVVAYECVP